MFNTIFGRASRANNSPAFPMQAHPRAPLAEWIEGHGGLTRDDLVRLVAIHAAIVGADGRDIKEAIAVAVEAAREAMK